MQGSFLLLQGFLICFFNDFKDCPQFPGDSCRAAPGHHRPVHTRNFCQAGPSSTGCAERDRQLGRSLCKHRGQSNTNLPPAPPGGGSGNKPDVLPQSFTLPAFAVSPAWPFPCLAALPQTSLNCLSSGCLLLRCLLPITQVSYKSVKQPQLQQGWHHVPVLLLVLTSPFAIFSTSPDAPHQRHSNKYEFAGCREHLSKLPTPTCWMGWGGTHLQCFLEPPGVLFFPISFIAQAPISKYHLPKWSSAAAMLFHKIP